MHTYVRMYIEDFDSPLAEMCCVNFLLFLFLPFLQGEQFTFEQSWGEQLSSVTCPVAVVCDLESGQSDVVPTDPYNDISVGQVRMLFLLLMV